MNEPVTKPKSTLKGALERVGKLLSNINEVDGRFTPILIKPNRVTGVLETHDAAVKVGFAKEHVPLPPFESCQMSLSGKPWIDTNGGEVTIMVSSYRLKER